MKELKDDLYKKSTPLPAEIKFYPQKATALLTINKKHITLEAKRSVAEQFNLSEKEEFHFTIIGRKTGEEILNSLAPLGEVKKNKILNQIGELCESYNWQVVLEQKFYYLKKNYSEPDVRQSIIQRARIDKLDKFYQELNTLLGKNFRTPFPHVTLYATSTKEDKKSRGIGIYSKAQFDELKPQKI